MRESYDFYVFFCYSNIVYGTHSETGKKYRIAPAKPLAYHQWRELCHEATQSCPGESRVEVIKKAAEAKRYDRRPTAPTGENCVDVEVYTVNGNQDLHIRGTKPFQIRCNEIFPIVEAIFGPLRVPVPRTPQILHKEYSGAWRNERRVKTGGRHGKHHQWKELPLTAKRSAWPTVQLHGCAPLLGSYVGAGLHPDGSDRVWRFHGAGRLD